MTNRQISKSIKERSIELQESGSYQESRDEEFTVQFMKEFEPMFKSGEVFSEDDVKGFMDSFEFPDEWTWAEAEAQSEYETHADAQYESLKDERMGL